LSAYSGQYNINFHCLLFFYVSGMNACSSGNDHRNARVIDFFFDDSNHLVVVFFEGQQASDVFGFNSQAGTDGFQPSGTRESWPPVIAATSLSEIITVMGVFS
jgi:hypothetical protein